MKKFENEEIGQIRHDIASVVFILNILKDAIAENEPQDRQNLLVDSSIEKLNALIEIFS